MRTFILIILFLLAAGYTLEAQTLSARQESRLEKIDNLVKREKLRIKFLKKDSLQRFKRAKQQLISEAKQTLTGEIKNRIPGQNLPLDSAGIQQEVDGFKSGLKDKTNEALTKELGVDLSIISFDSTGLSKQKQLVVEKLKTTLKDTLQSYIDLPDIAIDSTSYDQLKSTVKGEAMDLINTELGVDLSLDSAQVDQLKVRAKQEAGERLASELGVDVSELTMDSTTLKRVEDQAVKRLEEELLKTDEFKQLQGEGSPLAGFDEIKGKIEQTQQEMQELMARNALKEKMVNKAKDFIIKNAGVIQDVQEQMGDLKKIYSSVPNSNDLSSAVKQKSLEDRKFGQRLVFGGNFTITKTDPIRMDLSPTIGYRINKLFEVGVTGMYRAEFKIKKTSTPFSDKNIYGYGVFASHLMFRSFFGYLEGQRLATAVTGNELGLVTWSEHLLLGIGKKFAINSGLEMQTIVTFDFLYDVHDGLYNSPVVFKTSIRSRGK